VSVLDRDLRPPPRRSPRRAGAAGAVPQDGSGPSRITLAGRELVAVRDEQAGAGAGEAVGRIHCAGVHYLLFETGSKPARDPTPLPQPGLAGILTRRELQIAMLISEGRCDKEIARQLGISGYTVREHIRRIFAKLKIGRRSAIVACVLRHQPHVPLGT